MQVSCRFIFGGTEGRLRHGPPNSFSAIFEAATGEILFPTFLENQSSTTRGSESKCIVLQKKSEFQIKSTSTSVYRSATSPSLSTAARSGSYRK